MIKKAVLPLLTAPFLMVFSIDVFAAPLVNTTTTLCGINDSGCISNAVSSASSAISSALASDSAKAPQDVCYGYDRRLTNGQFNQWYHGVSAYLNRTSSIACGPNDPPIPDGYAMNDAQCKRNMGDSLTASASVANYLNSGGSAGAVGGACSFTGAAGVTSCSGDPVECSIPIEATSANEISDYNKEGDSIGEGEGTFSVIEFNTPEYLNELPGGCSDNSACVTIGDTSYLVDWDSAPDYFSYVDSNGTVHSKPSSGGGGGDNGGGDNGGGDPTNPTDPTDPGGDNGGGDGDTGGGDPGNDNGDTPGGGGSGGGSTVPDFEFDDSGIIEAIRSSGQSNRNSINALSNDVTGAISNQTNELNAATNAQTDSLNSTLSSQTDTLTSSLENQTDSLTGAIGDQTGTLTSSLDALGSSIVDAINAFGSGEAGDGEGEGEGEGEDAEGDGLLGGIARLLNGMVDNLASRFTEDLGSDNDLFNSSGMDDTLDGIAAQEEQHADDVGSLMDDIGDGATSGIADQVTSRLPSLPSGGCVPLQFGPMEISCQAFNTIKLWLTWIIYFWTVVSIVDTFFRSEQRTA